MQGYGLAISSAAVRRTCYWSASRLAMLLISGALVVSDHPLTRMLQEHLPASLPCIGIFEAGITQALLLGPSSRFAILSTGEGFKMRLHEGVSRLLGASGSTRFAGVITTGLGVVELRTGEPGHVQSKMKAGARRCVEELGADTIILGCAGQACLCYIYPEISAYCVFRAVGMAGMEPYIHEAAGSRSIRVLDGVKAGVELLKMLHNLSG